MTCICSRYVCPLDLSPLFSLFRCCWLQIEALVLNTSKQNLVISFFYQEKAYSSIPLPEASHPLGSALSRWKQGHHALRSQVYPSLCKDIAPLNGPL